MTSKTTLLTGVSLLALVITSQSAWADRNRMKPSYEELEKRIEDLERRMDEQGAGEDSELKTRVSTLEQRADEVNWSFDNLRPTVKSGDGRFSLSLRGRFHADWGTYFQDDTYAAGVPTSQRDLSGGAFIRRAQFGVEGKAWNDFWYEMRFDFGGSGTEGNGLVNLMRVAYSPDPDWRINAGIIQPIFTYADTVSSNDITFIERASIVTMAKDAFGGDDKRRGVELTYQHEHLFWPGDNVVISTAFTGQQISQADTRDETTFWLGRAAWRLWNDGLSNFQIGASASQLLDIQGTPPHILTFSDRPEQRSDGTALITTNNVAGGTCTALAAANNNCAMAVDGAFMYGFEAGLNLENFYIGGEYFNFQTSRDAPRFNTGTTAEPEFSGWYVEGSWFITGESKPYAAKSTSNNYAVWGTPRVIKPFSLSGDSWGAWELAVRYSNADLNFNEGVVGAAVPLGGVRGGEQNIWTLGINWYLNNNIRMMFDVNDVDIDQIAAGNLGAGSTTNQFSGQEFNTLAGRLQFAF